MRVLVQHRTHYGYDKPANFGPHLLRLRPANHTRAKIEAYSLDVHPAGAVHWQQDPSGNNVARITFDKCEPTTALDILVELAVELRPVNPFDFFLDERCDQTPFVYPPELQPDLKPFLQDQLPKGRLAGFLAELPASGRTVDLVVELNRLVNQRIRYVLREEIGIWTPEQTLTEGRGSCRDSAVLLVEVLRSRGFAARFVSGYLIQLADEGMIPDEPRGIGRDVVDLHAWAEVYLPGGGWIGLDATSGLLCGEGHIPLACTASPPLAAPIDGTADQNATDVSFAMTIARLGHEPRPTSPYPEEVWHGLVEAAARTDERLRKEKVTLTMGGEPTFNARKDAELPEWNGGALGASKWRLGRKLAGELLRRLAPGGVTLLRAGKHYPGEALPRWALDLIGRSNGEPLWPARVASAPGDIDGARKLAMKLAARLGCESAPQPAFEDPWRFLQEEASLPIDVDPLRADLDDSAERKRLAAVLQRGLGREVGFVLPLARSDGEWKSDEWRFRRGHLFLVPGDSPIGLRLPLGSLGGTPFPPEPPVEENSYPRDPRRPKPEDEKQPKVPGSRVVRPQLAVRTALCVEPRDGLLHVFLPPLGRTASFIELVEALSAVSAELGLEVQLEGYPPPSGPELKRFAVTPDPGVLEVNLPVSHDLKEYTALVDEVFDAALHSELHSEKYLLDGRMAGSGGGNHLTLGGPTALESPFLRRPDLLASLITFWQHHPSLSYLFTGLFVGPTSQAPRVDEARHDSLYELEIALQKAFSTINAEPWLSDQLFRNLLVDLSGNTHRSEICIDKLFDPQTAYGRQGVVELRAFEMPPHPRMVVAQMALVRSLVATFAGEKYQHPLARWGLLLHDRYLLPYWLWDDFTQVLEHLQQHGLPLDPEVFRPFLELRCPVAGTVQAEGVLVEVRNALEPWPVLGEELTSSGTARYVDSSLERIQVRTEGMIPERHRVLVNGHHLPMRATKVAGEHVAGVRFRAWAPPHSLQAHIGIHHPIRIDVVDTWARRSLGACAYHVWHPEGRGYESPPLTRFEASARRAARFTVEGQLPWPVSPRPTTEHLDAPNTLDLRRFPMDHPPPEPDDKE